MTNCTCGAAMAKHPAAGYSEAGACLEALKASNVKTVCDWPGCGKRVRKSYLGRNFCTAHRKLEFGAFMGMMLIEGPSCLNRPTPTLAECFEFAQSGGKELPASRRVPVTFDTTVVTCATCSSPLIVVNDPDWSPDLPNAMSCRDSETPWGIGICRKCSFPEQAATA